MGFEDECTYEVTPLLSLLLGPLFTIFCTLFLHFDMMGFLKAFVYGIPYQKTEPGSVKKVIVALNL